MTLEEIKESIISATIPLEICEAYTDILNAATEEELISAGKEFVEWAYQQNIITESLINEFSQATLNANGIYNTGSHIILNRVLDIFILGDADVTLTFSDNKKHRVVILGEGIATINLSGNSYAKIQKLQSTSNINISLVDNAACMFEMQGSGLTNVTAGDNSVFHSFIRSVSLLNYTGSNYSVANIKIYENSVLSYLLNDNAQLIKKAFDQSIINESLS